MMPTLPRRPVDRIADGLAGLLLAFALGFVLWTFADYGISVDEWVNQRAGTLMWAYLLSLGADDRILHYHDLRYYGPWFQMLAVLVGKGLSLPPFDARHLLGGLVAWLTLGLAWRIGRRTLGPAGGLVTLILLLMTGYVVGNAFNNPIDLPFTFVAALYLLALNRYAGELASAGRSGGWPVAAVGLALGLVVATRVGGGILVVPLLILAAALLVAPPPAVPRPVLARRLLIDGLSIAGLAAGVGYALWPWLWPAPLARLPEALGRFSQMPVDIVIPMFGQGVRSTDLPAWYLPANLAVRLPLGFVALLVAAPLVLPLFRCAGRRASADPAAAGTSWSAGQWLALLNCATVALVPIAFAILARTVLYDGFRHVLFVLVPLAVLAAAAAMAIARCWPWSKPLLIGALLLDLALTLPVLVALHPYQYVYFNRLVGGPAGAAGRFEGEYWFASGKEAARRLVARLVEEEGPAVLERPVRVGLCILGHDIEGLPLPPAWTVITRPQTPEVDFMIRFERNLCPWADAYPAYVTVGRLGIPFAVVRDLRR